MAAAAVLALLVWLVLPGLRRCYSYQRLISDPDIFQRLNVPVSDIELPGNEREASFSLGYSRFALGSAHVDSIKCYGTAVTIESGRIGFGFLRPFSSSCDSSGFDANDVAAEFDFWSRDLSIPVREPYRWETSQVHPVAQRLAQEMMQDRFTWSVEVARTMPRNYSDVFRAEPDELKEYLILAMAKAALSLKANRVEVFDGEYVRGLLRSERTGEPGGLSAEVYPKDSDVWQTIIVRSDSEQRSRDALLPLLASYRFVIAEVPDDEDLEQLVVEAIREHPRFQWAGERTSTSPMGSKGAR